LTTGGLHRQSSLGWWCPSSRVTLPLSAQCLEFSGNIPTAVVFPKLCSGLRSGLFGNQTLGSTKLGTKFSFKKATVCLNRWDSAPKRGTNFRPMSVVARRFDGSRYHLVGRYTLKIWNSWRVVKRSTNVHRVFRSGTWAFYVRLMVKTGQFTTQCKDDNVICLKRQISFLLVDWQNR